MNIFNKIILVIILLFFIFVSFVSIANEFVGFIKWSEIANRVFNPKININPYVSTLALLMVIIICVFLLLLEFYRRKVKIAKVYNVESGKAMITLTTISQQIKDTVLKIEGLKSAKIVIISKANGIIINMMAELGQSVNIPEKMNEIINAAKDVAVNKLYIKVIDTNLTIVSLVPEEGGPKIEPKVEVKTEPKAEPKTVEIKTEAEIEAEGEEKNK
jgi:hypothetical protein